MPSVQTTLPCPNCRQPVRALVDQLFDVTASPADKQRFLRGQFNLIQCPNCRYQGAVATPLVYHDADKELLLTFFPMELAMPKPEQEKLVGRLVNQVMSALPAEKRKGYLFKPSEVFTLQGLMDRVLEADGVTREMMDAQRKKAGLLQEMLRAPDDSLPALIQQRDADIDEEFLQLLSLAGAGAGDQRTADRLGAIQQGILDHSTIGKDLKAQQADLEAAAKALQTAGDRLTQETFLELVVKAPNENQAMAMVGMVPNGVDYNFFQMLTRKIERASGEEKVRLTSLRDKILEFTKEMDAAAEAQAKNAGEMLKALLEASDVDAMLEQLLPRIDETFLAVLSANLQTAEKAGRKDLVERLNYIGNVIMAAVAESAPPEIRLINELMALPDDEQAKRYLRERAKEMTQQVFDTMTYVAEDLRKNGRAEAADRLEKLHGLAMAEAMAARFKE